MNHSLYGKFILNILGVRLVFSVRRVGCVYLRGQVTVDEIKVWGDMFLFFEVLAT
jgi:hypothetical protein